MPVAAAAVGLALGVLLSVSAGDTLASEAAVGAADGAAVFVSVGCGLTDAPRQPVRAIKKADAAIESFMLRAKDMSIPPCSIRGYVYRRGKRQICFTSMAFELRV
jgi:hypothetical protein